jgi:hypothetical protein
MLTLTQKRPQSELVQLLKSTKNTPAKKARPMNALRYLDAKEMDQHMGEIHDRLFRKLATAQDRAACLEIAKGFTYTIPYVDIYLELLALIKKLFSEAVEEAYGEVWQIAPKEWRNHITRGARNYITKADRASDELRAFVNRQAGHLNALNDEQAELVMDLESTEIDLSISSEMGTYIEPDNEQREENWQRAGQIAANLRIWSQHAIQAEATTLGRQLKEKGWPHTQRKVKGQTVTGYYVKIKAEIIR